MKPTLTRRADARAAARGAGNPPLKPLHFLPARLGQTARSTAEIITKKRLRIRLAMWLEEYLLEEPVERAEQAELSELWE